MRHFYRTVISTQPITDTLKKEVEDVQVFNSHVTYHNTFVYDPTFLERVYSAHNIIDPGSLYTETKHYKAHSIFVYLTDSEWARLNLRENYYGKAWWVRDRVISYGRWKEGSDYIRAPHFKEPVKSLSELGIGIAHEEGHKLHALLGHGKDLTHYHFYGLAKETTDDTKSANRYRRTPTPIEYYDSFDWSKLPDLDPPVPPKVETPDISSIVLHHTGVSLKANKKQFSAVNEYHRNKPYPRSSRGYFTGYNFFIDGSGEVTQTREIGEETMAQVGHNCIGGSCAISICLTGNFNTELPSDAQIESLRGLLGVLKETYETVPVVSHRDVQQARTCPGVLLTNDYIKNVILGDGVDEGALDREKREALERELRKKQRQLAVTLWRYVQVLLAKLKGNK